MTDKKIKQMIKILSQGKTRSKSLFILLNLIKKYKGHISQRIAEKHGLGGKSYQIALNFLLNIRVIKCVEKGHGKIKGKNYHSPKYEYTSLLEERLTDYLALHIRQWFFDIKWETTPFYIPSEIKKKLSSELYEEIEQKLCDKKFLIFKGWDHISGPHKSRPVKYFVISSHFADKFFDDYLYEHQKEQNLKTLERKKRVLSN